MARRLYGASPADFTFTTAGGDIALAPGTSLAVATRDQAGAFVRITQRLESFAGTPVTTVTSDAAGEVRFYATDQPSDLWVAGIDGLGNIPGPWYVIRPSDLGGRLDAAEAAQENTDDLVATIQGSLAALTSRVDALAGVAAPIANPTGLAVTFDESTRRPTATWTLPTTGRLRLALTGSTGVTASSIDVEAGAQSYAFTTALPAGSGYFQVTATSLDTAGQPIGVPATARVSPKVGVTLTTPAATGRVVSTTVRVTGGDGTALAVGVRAQTLNGSGTVLSSVDLPNVQATTAGVTASWTVPDSTTATVVRFTATATGVAAVMTPSVSVASNLSTVDAVSGVDGYFDASSRLATVTWATPRSGSVTVTRADNLGGTGTTSPSGGAASGSYTFTAPVAQAATSLQLTVTGSDGSSGSKTLDVTAPATIPTDAVTAPSAAFATTGTWQSGDASEIYTSTAAATASLDFTGTYFQLVVVTDSHHGTLTLKIDNAAAVTLNEKTTARNTSAILYTATTLTSGAHKAVITATGDGTITVVSAKVASYSGAPVTPPTGGGGTTTPVTGFITRDPNAARLLLGGKTWKFVGFNGVNFFGATNSQRQITDYEDYYANKAPNEVTRVWFQPGMGSNFTQMDAVIAAAKRHNAKVYITLFDALGTYGPGWDAMKSQWSTYSQHVARVVGRYKDETAVAFWEIANEPPQDKAGFDLVGAAIKAIDSNHLVSTGTNATYSDSGIAAFQTAGSSQYVDILSMHEYDSLQVTSSHLARHLPVCRTLKKPLIVGEFGIDANADGSGVGQTGHNGATTFAGRANLIKQKADGYLNTAEVAGISYWSIGKNDIGTGADSYMAYSDTLGINAMKAATSKWSMNSVTA